MLSESQERMLAVVKAGREAEALAIFEKWDLDAAVIGRVTDTGKIVVKEGGRCRPRSRSRRSPRDCATSARSPVPPPSTKSVRSTSRR